MADVVALTEIRHGDKDGNVKVIPMGEKVTKSDFSADEYKNLESAGAVGDPASLSVNLGSTSSILQREDSDSLTNSPPNAAPAGNTASEEDVAKALDEATNQVARGENQAQTTEKKATK